MNVEHLYYGNNVGILPFVAIVGGYGRTIAVSILPFGCRLPQKYMVERLCYGNILDNLPLKFHKEIPQLMELFQAREEVPQKSSGTFLSLSSIVWNFFRHEVP